MATEQPIFCVGKFTAKTDLSGSQFHIVKIDGEGQIGRCSATTDRPLGVLQNDPKAGQVANVMIVGISKCETTRASSRQAIAAGDPVGTDASGRAEKKANDSTPTDCAVGLALTASASSTSADLIEVVLGAPGLHASYDSA